MTCASDHSSQRMTGTSVIPSLLRGFQPQIAVDYVAIAAGQDRDLETELLNGSHHLLDRVIVLAQTAAVRYKLAEG